MTRTEKLEAAKKTSTISWDNPPGFHIEPHWWSMWGDVNPKMEWCVRISEVLEVGDKMYLAKLYQPPKCRDQKRPGDLWDRLNIMEFNEDLTKYRSCWAKVDFGWIDEWRWLW